MADRHDVSAWDRRKIGVLSRALRRRTLSPREHQILGQLAKIVREEGGSAPLVATVRYNLKIAETQVGRVLARGGAERFDDGAIATLPDASQRKVVERLERIEKRLDRAGARRRIEGYSTATFRCLEDYETCRTRGDAAGYWCAMTLLVCLAGQIAMSVTAGKKTD